MLFFHCQSFADFVIWNCFKQGQGHTTVSSFACFNKNSMQILQALNHSFISFLPLRHNRVYKTLLRGCIVRKDKSRATREFFLMYWFRCFRKRWVFPCWLKTAIDSAVPKIENSFLKSHIKAHALMGWIDKHTGRLIANIVNSDKMGPVFPMCLQ